MDALYILGDLFEFWIGDDAASSIGQMEVLLQIKHVTQQGLPVYFMRGNRDFLVGNQFAKITGCELLHDPSVIEINGQQVLLTHGDSLCTDDTIHQKFRADVTTNQEWQKKFLKRSIQDRIDLALDARSQSDLHKSMTSMEVMDVNSETVRKVMAAHQVDHMIHGHTHRPAIHIMEHNAEGSKRIVLGDWYAQSSVLYCTDEFRLVPDPSR